MTPIEALLPQPAASCPSVLVLAAHPGDEILGASSVLTSGLACVVVHLTDGAPFERELWPKDRAFASREAYARERRREAESALAFCGVPREQVLSLSCPEQRAAWSLLPLCQRLAAIVERYGPDCVLTHAYEGFHPDHDAAAFIAYGALRMIEGESHATLLEMATSHAAPRELQTNRFLAVTGTRAFTHVLSEAEQAHKRAMLACHTSQQAVLSSVGLTWERFRRAPAYDFTRAPHAGVLSYERVDMDMPTSARTFCRLAAQTARALGFAQGRRLGPLGGRAAWR